MAKNPQLKEYVFNTTFTHYLWFNLLDLFIGT